MMFCYKFIAFVAILIVGWGRYCDCQVFFGGKCEHLDRFKHLEVKKFMGVWYEFQKYPSDFEKTSKCNMLTLELKKSGEVKVLKSRYDTLAKEYVEMLGVAKNVKNGKISVQFKDEDATAKSRYEVLDTDYDNYAVLYSCTPITDHYHTVMVWVMTRAKHPKGGDIIDAFVNLAKNNLPTSYLTGTNQNGCTRDPSVISTLMQLAQTQKSSEVLYN